MVIRFNTAINFLNANFGKCFNNHLIKGYQRPSKSPSFLLKTITGLVICCPSLKFNNNYGILHKSISWAFYFVGSSGIRHT